MSKPEPADKPCHCHTCRCPNYTTRADKNVSGRQVCWLCWQGYHKPQARVIAGGRAA